MSPNGDPKASYTLEQRVAINSAAKAFPTGFLFVLPDGRIHGENLDPARVEALKLSMLRFLCSSVEAGLRHMTRGER